MGSSLNKKNDNFQMNFFLYENSKQFLKLNKDSNSLRRKSIPSDDKDSSSTCCCLNFSSSFNWKDHFMERTEYLKEKYNWIKYMKSFIKKITIEKDEVFLSKFSLKIFVTINHPNSNELFNPIMDVCSASNQATSLLSYKSNCILTDIEPPKKVKESSRRNSKRKKSVFLSSAKRSKVKQFMPNCFINSRAEYLYLDQNEESKNKYFNLNLYKIMTDEIMAHLNDETHGLALLKNEFICYFMKNYCDFSKTKSYSQKEAEKIIMELKLFIRVFTECLMAFYKLEELSEYLMKSFKSQMNYFKFDNFSIFVTNLIFNEEIFNFILYLQKNFIDKEEELLFESQLEKIKDYDIEDFEISHEFTLDEKTIKLLSKSFSSPLEIPYSKLINSIKTIEILKSPFFQFKLLNNVSDSISKEINEFYENFQSNFTDSLDTDNFLSLHIYIVAKSNVKSLISFLNLIEKFSTEKQIKMELPGYYLAMYRASIEYIKNI